MSANASWDHLATFLCVMQAGSLSGAARALSITQPTVRRQIEDLERDLGTVLFTRSPNGLRATAAAQAMLPYAASMAMAARALARTARSDASEPSGTVRVTCSEIIAAEVAPGILGPLIKQHEALTLELAATDRNEDLLRREADVAVRMVRPTQSALVTKWVGNIALGLYAHRDYFRDRAVPDQLDDLVSGHILITGDRQDPMGPALSRSGADLSKLRMALRSDNSLVQLASLRAGAGIGVCQVGIAMRDPALVAVCPDLILTIPVWVVTHEDLRHQPRVRVVFDRLVEGLRDYSTIRPEGRRDLGAP